MNDTTPDIAKKMREMIQMKTPSERIKMGFSMYETSKYLVARAIQENKAIYPPDKRKLGPLGPR
jgi:hypothetical protein